MARRMNTRRRPPVRLVLAILAAVILVAGGCTDGSGPRDTGTLRLQLPPLTQAPAVDEGSQLACAQGAGLELGQARVTIIVFGDAEGKSEPLARKVLVVPETQEFVKTTIDNLPVESKYFVQVLIEYFDPQSQQFESAFVGEIQDVEVISESSTPIEVGVQPVGNTVTLSVDPNGVWRDPCCPDKDGDFPVVVPIRMEQAKPVAFVEFEIEYPDGDMTPAYVLPHPDLWQNPNISWTWSVRVNPAGPDAVYFRVSNLNPPDEIWTGHEALALLYFRAPDVPAGTPVLLPIRAVRVADGGCNEYVSFVYDRSFEVPKVPAL